MYCGNYKVSTGESSYDLMSVLLHRVSRSEISVRSGQSSNVQTVSAYLVDQLVCEGSELCFEEVRAQKYFRKLREKQDEEQQKISKLKVYGSNDFGPTRVKNEPPILTQGLRGAFY